MTLRDKVGQLVMVGFTGADLSPDFISWLQEFRPGGVILFARNLVAPSQVAQLTCTLQEVTPHSPILIAIDQEGGRVSRLPHGFTIFPPAATIAACQSSTLAYQVAEATARELHAVGINMNMAPVLDVNTNPNNPIIGDRAFGSDPKMVCDLGGATLRGLQDHGIVACGKHFPGHGDTSTDSHVELPIMDLPKERLNRVELAPFRYGIQHGLATMMTAHVCYPSFDPEVPATLSPVILTTLLREELRFSGLVLTDDLEMQGILDHCSIGEAGVRAIQAGADMLLICHRQDRQAEAIMAVEKAVVGGHIAMERIDANLERLSMVKKRFITSRPRVELNRISEVVGAPAHRQLLKSISQTSTTTQP